jgi:universal stress protein A
MTIRRIVYASDFSTASRPALKLAASLARTLKATLIICHASEPMSSLVGEASIPPRLFMQMMMATRVRDRRKLDALAKSVRAGRLKVTTLLLEGTAARAIVRAARTRHADLLVLGTHGRTGVQRMLLGSIAERVVRTAPCPVLTVRRRTS